MVENGSIGVRACWTDSEVALGYHGKLIRTETYRIWFLWPHEESDDERESREDGKPKEEVFVIRKLGVC